MLSESCHLNDLMYVKVVEGKYCGIAQDDNNRIITLVERSVTSFLISTNKARGNYSCIT